jgi:hypothetical protein
MELLDVDDPNAPQGSQGIYRARFALTPGEPPFLANVDVDDIVNRGSSLITAKPDEVPLLYALEMVDGAPAGGVLLHANSAGVLFQAEASVSAASFDDAEVAAFDHVLPCLSRLSFEYDTPLGVGAFEIVEQATGIRRTSAPLLGAPARWRPDSKHLSRPEHRSLLSAYREGLTSASPLYQTICFFRVIEGVRKVRATRHQDAEAAGLTIDASQEKMPDGRKLTVVIDEHWELMRNALAHLNPESDHVVADRHADVLACERALPELRYVAHAMLATELRAEGKPEAPASSA